MYSRFNSLELLFGNPQERKPGSKLGSFVLKGYFEYFKYKMNPENEQLYGFKKKNKFQNMWSSEKVDDFNINSDSFESVQNIQINIVKESEDESNIMESKSLNPQKSQLLGTSRKSSIKSSNSNQFFNDKKSFNNQSKSLIQNLSSEGNIGYNIYTDESEESQIKSVGHQGSNKSFRKSKLASKKSFMSRNSQLDAESSNLSILKKFQAQQEKKIKFKSKSRMSSMINSPNKSIEPIIEDNLEDILPTNLESTPRKKPKIKLESAFAEEYLDILKSLPFLLCYFFLDLTNVATERKKQFENQNIFENKQQMMAAVCLSAQVVLSKSKYEDTMSLLDLENLLFVYKNTFAPNISEMQTKLILEDFKIQQKNISAHRLTVKYTLEHLTCLLGYLEDNNNTQKKIKAVHKKMSTNMIKNFWGKSNVNDSNSTSSFHKKRKFSMKSPEPRKSRNVKFGMMGDDECIANQLQVSSIHENMIWRLCHFLYHKKIFWVTYEIRKNLLVFLPKMQRTNKGIKIKRVFRALAESLATIFPHAHEFTIFKVSLIRFF
jgi:hypothetical protein